MFGLPFDAVLETVRVPRSQIRPLSSGRVLVLRDLTIPCSTWRPALELDVKQSGRGDVACLVIASVAGQRVGIESISPANVSTLCSSLSRVCWQACARFRDQPAGRRPRPDRPRSGSLVRMSVSHASDGQIRLSGAVSLDEALFCAS